MICTEWYSVIDDLHIILKQDLRVISSIPYQHILEIHLLTYLNIQHQIFYIMQYIGNILIYHKHTYVHQGTHTSFLLLFRVLDLGGGAEVMNLRMRGRSGAQNHHSNEENVSFLLHFLSQLTGCRLPRSAHMFLCRIRNIFLCLYLGQCTP